MDELEIADNPDLALNVIEHLDSYWLQKEGEKIRRKHGN